MVLKKHHLFHRFFSVKSHTACDMVNNTLIWSIQWPVIWSIKAPNGLIRLVNHTGKSDGACFRHIKNQNQFQNQLHH